ncbi:MAG: putative toxin-antitoxin system toxin component, PIN family [Oscillospiraceae bacterium]|nr:putative toxin-antitoxin system toxin component, PIN family [Oscillospiraceae bacterium]
MRIMADTNVIISAILKEGSICDEILNDICENHELILCDYIINECYNVAKRKFPTKIYVLDKLFAKLRYELIPAPRAEKVEMKDAKDQPILNAAIKYGVDILVSGDWHFLELSIEMPQIMSPTKYKKMKI